MRLLSSSRGRWYLLAALWAALLILGTGGFVQQAAEAGEVLIGPTAYRLTLGRVETEERGLLELRGMAEPMPAWA